MKSTRYDKWERRFFLLVLLNYMTVQKKKRKYNMFGDLLISHICKTTVLRMGKEKMRVFSCLKVLM